VAAEEKRIREMMNNLEGVSGGAKITGVGDLISADQIQQVGNSDDHLFGVIQNTC
jgi:hypothetical protein